MAHLTFDSPLGPLTLTDEDGAITRLTWWGEKADETTPLLDEAARQLAQYFASERQVFDLPLAPKASASGHRFLKALQDIPYGETRTYGEMAKAIEVSLPQAAGQACGANPIGVIIPCHRVTGTGNLGGFSGPRWHRKEGGTSEARRRGFTSDLGS